MNAIGSVMRLTRGLLGLFTAALLSLACTHQSQNTIGAGESGEFIMHDWVRQALAKVEGPGGKSTLAYDVAQCDLKFYLDKDNPDVDVEMAVTYNLWGGTKTAGYTPVGASKVEHIACVDEQGRSLSAGVQHGSGRYLVWRFPEMQVGCHTVTLRFKVLDALQQYGERYVLDMPWVGEWPVPVHRQTIEVLFPAGYRPKIVNVMPAKPSYETLMRNASPVERDWQHGKFAVRQTQMPLTYKQFHLEYREE